VSGKPRRRKGGKTGREGGRIENSKSTAIRIDSLISSALPPSLPPSLPLSGLQESDRGHQQALQVPLEPFHQPKGGREGGREGGRKRKREERRMTYICLCPPFKKEFVKRRGKGNPTKKEKQIKKIMGKGCYHKAKQRAICFPPSTISMYIYVCVCTPAVTFFLSFVSPPPLPPSHLLLLK